MSWLESCRICRESVCSKKVTFKLDSDWSSLFEFCFGLQITQDGPLLFCEVCSTKLHDYGELKKLCLQSEEIWKSVTNSLTLRDRHVDETNVAKEENIEENTVFPDPFDCDDNDYNLIVVLKEENEKNLVKKLEDKLTEISIKKIEIPLTKNKEPKHAKETQKTGMKKLKNTKRCKYRDKRDKKLKSSKNKSKVLVKQEASVKQETTDFSCGLCDFTSTTSVELNEHLLRHCQENMLNCLLCSFQGKDVAHMISHRYSHCPKLGNKLECPLCSAVCFIDKKLEFHYRSVHLGNKGGLCIICGRTFKNYKQWKCHEMGHVSRNFICDHCGMSFVQRYNIEEHMTVHYDIFKFICDICGKGFKKASNLKSHYYNHHTEHKKVSCTICNIKFKHDGYLKKHIQQRHSQKKFLCEVCSKGFCTNQMLREHVYYYHSDEKPYACDVCGVRYRANLGLKIHKRIHTGELPYTCPECGVGFRSSSLLKRHQIVHTGVRPVKCIYCDKTFNSKRQMLAHCNSKHKDVM